MRRPAAGARDDEQGGKHRRRHPHPVVGHGRIPVEVCKHLLLAHHHRLDALGDLEHPHVARLLRQLARDFLDDLVARIGDGVDRVAETDHHLLVGDAGDDVILRGLRRLVAVHHLEADLVGTTMFGAAQRADAAGDRRVHVGAGAGDDAAGEGRGVVFVLGVEVQRGVHRAHPGVGGRFAVQQVQEVPADRVIIGLDLDAFAVLAPVVPVEQHRAERGHQPVGDVARARDAVVFTLRHRRAQRRAAGAHDVHRVRRRRQLLQHLAHHRGQPAQ